MKKWEHKMERVGIRMRDTDVSPGELTACDCGSTSLYRKDHDATGPISCPVSNGPGLFEQKNNVGKKNTVRMKANR